MAKYGSYGGNMGNMQNLIKQAQQVQQQMQKAQQELAETEVTGSAGGGMVEITMTCTKQLTAVSIKPEAVDPDDVEMLEDLITAAFNDAMSQADEETKAKMGPFAGAAGGMF